MLINEIHHMVGIAVLVLYIRYHHLAICFQNNLIQSQHQVRIYLNIVFVFFRNKLIIK